ncbi:response regulator transcription factor NblR [Microcoleus sp. FACHB-672]|uniref:response regulator transcription factor NblR n=1 Tax=Microcoleus sp. FACHB-672 TaxID=2692825 RepID=UPI001F5567AA|nr:response regulator transcription factor [Microcoleus sp. FACHB-672]
MPNHSELLTRAIMLDRNPCVLLIETDAALAHNVSLDLKESGYEPVVAYDATTGLSQADQLQPSLIVVDRMLAGESGLQLCTQLRRVGNRAPVLLLMARDSVDDRVACLEAGADDYFLKPYRSEDFLQLVRLYLQPDAPGTEQLRFGDLVLDLSTRRALRNGRVIELTMKEYELLKYLMEHPREVLTRDQILENVWGYDFMGESNVIEVYIRYLRLKIEDEGQKRLIQTVRGVGYVLREA